MNHDISEELQDKVCHICNQLLNKNQFITTNTVITELNKTYSNCCLNYSEDKIISSINFWRLSRISRTSDGDKNEFFTEDHLDNCRCRERLIKAIREIRFLKAKMQALNSFYNRQRKEFIMRIEGMLYK